MEKLNIENSDLFNFIRVYNQIEIDRPEKQMIYHYTSADALLSILASETLWFSDSSYLNDASEGILPLNILEDILDLVDINTIMLERLKVCIKERKEKILCDTNRAYILSFSIDPDSLCLWNYYTKGNQSQGYNIGFQADLLTKAFHGTKPGTSSAYIPIQGRVEYEQQKQKDLVHRVIKSLIDVSCDHDPIFTSEFILDKITSLGYFFKSECFGIEKEYRMVLVWNNHFHSEEYLLREESFRSMNGYFIPYRQVPFENSNCIKTITVSPTIDFELARTSLTRALRKYSGVEVKQSNIPVRY